MQYLTLEDLKTDSFERFIRESTDDFENALDKAEKRAIGIVSPYLRDRYNVDATFDPQKPIRDELLVEILVIFTLHKIHHRNAARKFSSDEDLKRAKDYLKDIIGGKITLSLPTAVSKSEQSEGTSIWGSLRNNDFYI